MCDEIGYTCPKCNYTHDINEGGTCLNDNGTTDYGCVMCGHEWTEDTENIKYVVFADEDNEQVFKEDFETFVEEGCYEVMKVVSLTQLAECLYRANECGNYFFISEEEYNKL